MKSLILLLLMKNEYLKTSCTEAQEILVLPEFQNYTRNAVNKVRDEKYLIGIYF